MTIQITYRDKITLTKVSVLFVMIGLIMFAVSPFLIDFYFNHQPVYSIEGAQDYIHANKVYGKSIVVKGVVSHIFANGDFIMADSNSYISVYKTNRMNCVPSFGHPVKIVGAWNPDKTGLPQFYGIRVIGACE